MTLTDDQEQAVSRRRLYYFAHPYAVKRADGSHVYTAEEANWRLACVRSAELLRCGYWVFSPVVHTHPMHCVMPESIAQDSFSWYELDLLMIERTEFDGIILAPGWERSTGCQRERDSCIERGKLVLLYGDIIGGKGAES